jgi:hypothetical protein
MIPRFIKSVSLIVFALALASPATAQSGVGFALVGVSTAQTARVNAVNAGSSSSTPDSSCTVTMQFLDIQGLVVKQTVATLQPGKGASLDVSRDQLAGTDLRAEVRAVLYFGNSGGAPPGPDVAPQLDCNIIPSLQVFDNATGRTSFILTDTKSLTSADPRNLMRTGRAQAR